MTKVALILCLVWMSNPTCGQDIARRLWRNADEILLVKIVNEEGSSFGVLSIGTCLTHVTAEIVTVYKFKRIDTTRREMMFGRIFSCQKYLKPDEGLLNPEKQYVVFLDSEDPGKGADGRPTYSLADYFLGIHEYTYELDWVLKKRRK